MSDARKEFGLGWKVLIAALFGTMCGASPVPFSTIGSFLMPLEADYGWNAGQVMTGVTIFGVTACLLAPVFGRMADRFGVRRVAILSLLAFGLTFAAFGLTPNSLPIFYGLWFILGLIGIGSTPVTWSRAVNMWFVSNRGLALGIMLVGTGVAGFVLPSLATYLIGTLGWRWAYGLIALLPLGLAMPIVLLYFREPTKAEISASPTLAANLTGVSVKQGLKNYRFWIMWTSFFLVALAYGGFYTNLQNMLVIKGYSRADAAFVAGFLGLSIVFGRVISGYLIDRFWAPLITFPLLSLPAVACYFYSGSTIHMGVAIIGAICLGFAAGAESDLIAYLAGRYFGMANYGTLYGFLYMAFGLGSSFSPALYGYAYVKYGSYTPVLTVAGGLLLFGSCLLLLLGRYPILNEVAAEA